MQRLHATLVIALLLGTASAVQAQSNAQQLAEVNRAAMDAYNNLDIETAKTKLEQAAQNAERAGMGGPALARTYANLGVVLIGGLGDTEGGYRAFVRALQEDPKVEPDPIVATPEIMDVFKRASQKNAGRGQSGGGAAPAPVVASGPVEGDLDHEPVPEQLSQTAIPVFVAKGGVEAARMVVFYRSLGMDQPKSEVMEETEEGFKLLIPCTDVFEPAVEYYIVAEDDDGEQVGYMGTAQTPVVVPVVRERTHPAPALPGEVPPEQCTGGAECPPGMPGCGGQAGLGDTCRSDSDCQSGLICADDFCSMGERKEDDGEEGDYEKFFLEVSFGLGATLLSGEHAPDELPPGATVDFIRDSWASMAENTTRVAEAQAYLFQQGWDCDVRFDGLGGAHVSNCSVALKQKGFVSLPVLNAALGYHLSPRLALALTGRFQIRSGDGPLAGILLGGRLDYTLNSPKPEGARVAVLIGAGIGSIQAQPPADEAGDSGPYATSSNTGTIGGAAQLGLRIGYRFSRNVGIHLIPMVNAGLPRFLLSIDALGGLDLAF